MDIVFEEAWLREDPEQAEEAGRFWEKLDVVPPSRHERPAEWNAPGPVDTSELSGRRVQIHFMI